MGKYRSVKSSVPTLLSMRTLYRDKPVMYYPYLFSQPVSNWGNNHATSRCAINRPSSAVRSSRPFLVKNRRGSIIRLTRLDRTSKWRETTDKQQTQKNVRGRKKRDVGDKVAHGCWLFYILNIMELCRSSATILHVCADVHVRLPQNKPAYIFRRLIILFCAATLYPKWSVHTFYH